MLHRRSRQAASEAAQLAEEGAGGVLEVRSRETRPEETTPHQNAAACCQRMRGLPAPLACTWMLRTCTARAALHAAMRSVRTLADTHRCLCTFLYCQAADCLRSAHAHAFASAPALSNNHLQAPPAALPQRRTKPLGCAAQVRSLQHLEAVVEAAGPAVVAVAFYSRVCARNCRL